MKRLLDVSVAFFGLLIFSPVILILVLIIWLQDFGNPLYIAERIGKDSIPFRMYKLRTMIINADSTGVDSTSSNDNRITSVGKFIRKFKIDEISQLINVLLGDMSLVGPRPNVLREILMYTDLEKELLTVKPGITDFASIVFSDEGEILSDSDDPDIDYNQLIRPGKGYLGIFYIRNQSIKLDLMLIFLTAIAILSRKKALHYIKKILISYKAESSLVNIASRETKLTPMPPMGSNEIVKNRNY